MHKNVFGRQFKRDTNERKALFKNLISSLILAEKIKTTKEKAKAIKSDIDKIITKAKNGEAARRILQSYLIQDAVDKVIQNIAPRFARRQGGYSRITKLGRRLSDNASMVLMEWTEDANSELEKPERFEADKAEEKLEERPSRKVVKSQKKKKRLVKRKSERSEKNSKKEIKK